jgi:hypothetical protein
MSYASYAAIASYSSFWHDEDMQPDPAEMAKAYLDAWQTQWSQLAADPAWQAAAAQQWQQFAGQMMTGMAPNATMPNHEPRTAAPAASSELGAQLLAECFMRIARLEARVADLESKLSK